MKTAIVSLVYHEPEWQQTKACVQLCNAAVHYVERNPAGIGNMAEAINRGFREVWESARRPDYVWFVSNVVFEPDLLWKLVTAADDTGAAAVHPCFASDHIFCQPKCEVIAGITIPVNGSNVTLAPFVEFTAPLVRADVFARFPLDETMPYWGHDLDWGYRVWDAGYKIGVLQSDRNLISHTYIRNTSRRGGDVTSQRYGLRIASNASTKHRLRQVYGPNYRDLIFPQSEPELEKWRNRILRKSVN